VLHSYWRTKDVSKAYDVLAKATCRSPDFPPCGVASKQDRKPGSGLSILLLRFEAGYGYNCAVVFDPLEANLPEGKGTFWDGAAGTRFWVDPTNDIVFVGMIQRMVGPGVPNLEYLSRSVVYQALVDPAK
jgi:CubicO group peptidase (beta-lactamase class C family)